MFLLLPLSLLPLLLLHDVCNLHAAIVSPVSPTFLPTQHGYCPESWTFLLNVLYVLLLLLLLYFYSYFYCFY